MLILELCLSESLWTSFNMLLRIIFIFLRSSWTIALYSLWSRFKDGCFSDALFNRERWSECFIFGYGLNIITVVIERIVILFNEKTQKSTPTWWTWMLSNSQVLSKLTVSYTCPSFPLCDIGYNKMWVNFHHFYANVS